MPAQYIAAQTHIYALTHLSIWVHTWRRRRGDRPPVGTERIEANTGEWEDYPNYIDCTMFGTRAEAVGRYISKGSKVAIEGKLRYSSWERDGQKRSKLEVIVDEIEFMNSRPAASPAAAVDGGQQYAVPEAPAVEVADEDIPF